MQKSISFFTNQTSDFNVQTAKYCCPNIYTVIFLFSNLLNNNNVHGKTNVYKCSFKFTLHCSIVHALHSLIYNSNQLLLLLSMHIYIRILSSALKTHPSQLHHGEIHSTQSNIWTGSATQIILCNSRLFYVAFSLHVRKHVKRKTYLTINVTLWSVISRIFHIIIQQIV